MTKIIYQMLILFFMLVIGYIAAKRKILNEESNKVMSRLVIYIASPALLLNTATSGQITGSKQTTLMIIGLSLIFFLVTPLLAKIVTAIVPFTRKNKGTYEAMYCFSNIGFMGIPVMSSIYGSEAVFYCAIFMIPFNMLVYTYGVLLLSQEKDAKIEWKKICNPAVIAALASLVIYFLDIKTHIVFNETVSYLGAMTTPLAMVTIGSTLSFIPLKDVFLDVKMYLFALIKLLLIPVVIFFMFKPFITNTVLLGVMVVISGMPIGSNVTIICNEYGGDYVTVTKGTFISTILCLVTIPILALTIL